MNYKKLHQTLSQNKIPIICLVIISLSLVIINFFPLQTDFSNFSLLKNLIDKERVRPTPIYISLEKSPRADTVLSLSSPTFVKNNSNLPVTLEVNSGQNQITALDILIKYDPQYLKLNTLTTGSFLSKCKLIEEKVNPIAGTIHLIFLSPLNQAITGQGNALKIDFQTLKATIDNPVTITILPQTKISAISENLSVLKSSISTPINITYE